MAKTISELKAQSAEVKNASAIGENTATRVGQLFGDIVEHVEQYENAKDTKDASQDTTMQSLVSAEESRAKGEERGLTNYIHAEEINRQTADAYLSELITNETSARATADDNIRNALNNEITRAKLAEQELAVAEVWTNRIQDSAVTTPKIADGAVTYEKTNIIAQELSDNEHNVPSSKVVKENIDGLAQAYGSETILREQGDDKLNASMTEKFGQLGLAEVLSNPVLVSPCITTYNSLLNSNSINSGYWLNNDIQEKIRNITLDSVWLKFTKSGTISLLRGTGIGTDNFIKEVIVKENVNVGWFPIKLPENFKLNSDEWLGINITGDTATFQLGLADLTSFKYSFYYFSNTWHTLSDRDLLMYITASFGKAIGPIPTLQKNSMTMQSNIEKLNKEGLLVDDTDSYILPIVDYLLLDQAEVIEVQPTINHDGGYYDKNGDLHTGSLSTKGGEYNLTELVGEEIVVNLGTTSNAYIVIENTEDKIIRRYQNLTIPLYFKVSSNMKTLKALGYSMNDKQGAYSGNFVSKIPKVVNNLVTDSYKDALSASMGKSLYDSITYKEILLPDVPNDGKYYDASGILHSKYSLNTKGGEYNLNKYIGSTLYVYLGTTGSAYITIEDTEGDIIRVYQSLDTPLIFEVTDNMKTLKALGYSMNEYYGVYSIKPKFNLIGQSKFRGGTIITIGDSITAGYNTTKIWANILADKIECCLSNYAVSGMQLSGGMTSKIDNITETSADLIFLFGGTNDWALGSKPLGELWTKGDDGVMVINNSTDTFAGGVVLAAQKLLSRFPKAKIYFITPLHRKTYKTQIASDLHPNNNGYYLYQYVDIIKEVCSYYSIPVIDLYSISGLNPNIETIAESYFNHTDGDLPDLLHPDENGHERISEIIKDFISN